MKQYRYCFERNDCYFQKSVLSTLFWKCFNLKVRNCSWSFTKSWGKMQNHDAFSSLAEIQRMRLVYVVHHMTQECRLRPLLQRLCKGSRCAAVSKQETALHPSIPHLFCVHWRQKPLGKNQTLSKPICNTFTHSYVHWLIARTLILPFDADGNEMLRTRTSS